MKTLILKSLLALGFILGLSAIACAQDGEKPNFKVKATGKVELSKEAVANHRALKPAKVKTVKEKRVSVKKPVKSLQYERYQLKKEVE
jgi:hypothetical protein